MKKDSGSSLVQAELRRRVDAKIMQTSVDPNQPRPSVAAARRLVEDLQIHQVELELQNQTLLEMRQQLEQSLKRYTDLYDFAPVGYATLASNGAIQEINRAGAKLLGMECAHLIERRLGLFVTADTRPIFKRFTGSAIAFLHFVDPDQEQVILQSWSSNTLQAHGKATGKGRSDPIKSSVWADGIRQRRSVIRNDRADLLDKKGLPEGHAPLIRELTVPILRNGGQPVAILGVGNKPEWKSRVSRGGRKRPRAGPGRVAGVPGGYSCDLIPFPIL